MDVLVLTLALGVRARVLCARCACTGLDLDFVEIGTSNFETLIQLASEDSKGLSVEGLKMYQDELPDKPGVVKVNAAISSEYASSPPPCTTCCCVATGASS